MKQYWVCIIGPVDSDDLPDGADSQPRNAAQNAVAAMVGHEHLSTWSGWGCDEKTKEAVLQTWNEGG